MKRFFLVVCCFVTLLTGCLSQQRLRDYYEDQNNYETATGTVCHIMYDEELAALYIGVEECPEGFDDTAFKLVGEGLTIARENGIDEVLQLGDEITFTCAPHYFGDGYVVPLAAISVEDRCFLNFEQGYEGLMNWLE